MNIVNANVDEFPTVIDFSEAGEGPLVSVTFDLTFEVFNGSFGSDFYLTLTHFGTAYVFRADGDTDFGWGNSAGVFNYAGTLLVDGSANRPVSPANVTGNWRLQLFDNDNNQPVPDGILNGSITLNLGEPVPVPGSLALILLGAGLLARRRPQS